MSGMKKSLCQQGRQLVPGSGKKGMTSLAKKDSATLETQSSISEAADPPFFGAQKRPKTMVVGMTIHIARDWL